MQNALKIDQVASPSLGVYSNRFPSVSRSRDAGLHYLNQYQRGQDRLESEIRESMETWVNDTLKFSSVQQMVSHPAYLHIISKGHRALPILFRELKREPNFWFTALQAITGENPVPDSLRGDVIAMQKCWIEWAEAEDYV